jgi:hypothetical protein
MVAGGDGCTGAVHYVELEIVSIYNDASCNVTVGVGRPGLDVEEENIDQGEADFWGVFDVGGTLYHTAVETGVGGISWTGQHGFGSGDTIGLLPDWYPRGIQERRTAGGTCHRPDGRAVLGDDDSGGRGSITWRAHQGQATPSRVA